MEPFSLPKEQGNTDFRIISNPELILDDQGDILCPECGFNHAHVIAVTWNTLDGEVRIILDGECGHTWSLVVRAHKGRNELLSAYIPVD